MRADWIAAGLPAPDFWAECPRGYHRIMEAIQRRERDRLLLTARAVWVGTRATQDELSDWEYAVLGRERPILQEDALETQLARASAGMPVLRMDDYRKGKSC